jgi:cardiolipin synthase C
LVHRLTFDWAVTRLISDDPAKGLGQAKEGALLWPRLKESIGTPRQALRLVSPYFVPGSAGVGALAAMSRQRVKIDVLTNALEATDVAVVHAGYAKRRRALLAAGVTLFELQREGPRRRGKKRSWAGRLGSGSSASSLHAKTFSVDRARVFIGSFNFDPRSARLNTEMGLVIDSPTMADAIAGRFADEVPARAYQLGLSAAGKLRWIDRRDGTEVVHDVEPGTTVWRRVAVWLLSWLPIEWLL